MKISSASKKVLASALSAAMVVAFAPTVAFGAQGEPITINVNANGGTATQTSFTGFKQGGTITLPGATKDGYNVYKWFVDEDGDGVKSASESYATGTGANDNGEAGDSFDLPTDKAEVTIAAEYGMPTTAISFNTGKVVVQNDGNEFVAKQHTYKLTVTNPNNTVLLEKTYAPADPTDPNGKATIVETAYTLNDNADAGLFTAGTYTAVLTDNGKTISTKTLKLVSVKIGDADPALYDVDNTTGLATVSLGGTYIDEAGFVVSGTVTVSGDAVFKAYDKAIGTADAPAYEESTRVVSFTVTDSVPVADKDDKDKYTVSVVDPTGAEIFAATASMVNGADANGKTPRSAAISFSFDQASALGHAAAAEVAGTYSINVTKVAADDGTVSTFKTSLVLTEVKFDAGTGSFKKDFKTADVFTDNPATVDTNNTGYKALASAAVKPADGYTFAGAWKVNGKTYVNATTSLKAGEVNTLTADYTAKGATVATPTFTVETQATNVGNYVIKVSCATPGAVIRYIADGTATSAATKIDVNGTQTAATTYNAATGIVVAKNSIQPVYIQALTAAGATDPTIVNSAATIMLTKNTYAADFAAATAGATSKLELGIGNGTDKWLSIEGIKAAAESGNTALQSLGVYYTDADAADAAYKAACKSLYEAVLAGATAEIDKYANGAPVVAGSKVYEMTTADKAAADKAIADIAKSVTAAESVKVENAGTYMANADNIVTTANAALKKAKESKTYTVADITAAQDVAAQLAAAKTGAEAEAALAAYAALTDSQKALVATADVAKAEAVAAEAKAAAELKVAQDDAAVSKARSASKTVKAGANGKTTKKQSVTLKKITSKSGAKVTYKKVSGKKAITVKSGKAYLAKGVKKGTYKATVKATCGTQTAKITVKFVVK